MTVQPSFWLDRWHNNAIGFHQAQVNADLRHYWPLLRCAPGSTVFVPLCGKSRDMQWLHAQGVNVLGIDLSTQAVQSFFSEQQLSCQTGINGSLESWRSANYELLVGDFFDLTAVQLAAVTVLYDRAALIALPPELRQSYARHLRTILPSRCRMLLLTMEYAQDQMAGPPFSMAPSAVQELYLQDFSITLLGSRDTLADEPRWQQRGLKQLHEHCLLLERRHGPTD